MVYNKVFNAEIPNKISLALLEALLVGVSFNLSSIEKKTENRVKALFNKLQRHKEFSEEKMSEGLSGKPRVIGRMKAAKKIFSGI